MLADGGSNPPDSTKYKKGEPLRFAFFVSALFVCYRTVRTNVNDKTLIVLENVMAATKIRLCAPALDICRYSGMELAPFGTTSSQCSTLQHHISQLAVEQVATRKLTQSLALRRPENGDIV